MINKQGHESVSRLSRMGKMWSAALMRLRSLFRPVDEAAADALRKEAERKARDAARAKARRDAKRHKPESADSVLESADSGFESADSAKTSAIRASVSSVRPGARILSLLKNKNLALREREYRGRIPLPPDWQPDPRTWQFALDRLGDEAAADRCFEKFRVHHETSGQSWTPKSWQSKAYGWVLKEEQFFGRQRSLPLVRVVGNTPAIAPMSPPADERWLPVWNRLKAELGDAVAASWFSDATLRAFVDGVATVELATKFKCGHVRTQYEPSVLRAVQAVHTGVTSVRFTVAQRSASG